MHVVWTTEATGKRTLRAGEPACKVWSLRTSKRSQAQARYLDSSFVRAVVVCPNDHDFVKWTGRSGVRDTESKLCDIVCSAYGTARDLAKTMLYERDKD